ncbi:MAG TPA: hypothetical protein VE081_10120, partial [Sporichthyaceae bacterium]|nr:hypothetical protein [Sporichthyaceae bacterium]
MTDHAPTTGSPVEPVPPAATTRQGEARDRSSRGLLALVPPSVEAAALRRASAHPLTPDLALIDPARLDVMFDPASLRQPVLRCVLERLAAILDGVAVLQTPAMVVMERAGEGDLVGVPLRPDVRPEDRDALDRALGLGGVTM